MPDIKWEAPPANAVAGGEKHTKWGAVAGLLRTNPGEWGIVATKNARPAAVALTNGIAAGKRDEFAPSGTFEAAYAQRPDNTFGVYARFLGEGSSNGAAPVAAESEHGVAYIDDGFGDDD